jgi:hypothetical protein
MAPTIDGGSFDWVHIEGFEFTLTDLDFREYFYGKLTTKCVHDNEHVYFLFELPGPYRLDSEDKHKSPSISTMLQIGSDAMYYVSEPSSTPEQPIRMNSFSSIFKQNHGNCPHASSSCAGDPSLCTDYNVDIGGYWEIFQTNMGVKYGINEEAGDGNISDEHAYNRDCHSNENDGNQWVGAWSHSSPAEGDLGKYTFEMSRPIKTEDKQTDAQLGVGKVTGFGFSYWVRRQIFSATLQYIVCTNFVMLYLQQHPYQLASGWTHEGHFVTGNSSDWTYLRLLDEEPIDTPSPTKSSSESPSISPSGTSTESPTMSPIVDPISEPSTSLPITSPRATDPATSSTTSSPATLHTLDAKAGKINANDAKSGKSVISQAPSSGKADKNEPSPGALLSSKSDKPSARPSSENTVGKLFDKGGKYILSEQPSSEPTLDSKAEKESSKSSKIDPNDEASWAEYSLMEAVSHNSETTSSKSDKPLIPLTASEFRTGAPESQDMSIASYEYLSSKSAKSEFQSSKSSKSGAHVFTGSKSSKSYSHSYSFSLTSSDDEIAEKNDGSNLKQNTLEENKPQVSSSNSDTESDRGTSPSEIRSSNSAPSLRLVTTFVVLLLHFII